MAKYPYFEALEALADMAARAVRQAVSELASPKKEDPLALRASAHKAMCEMEDALFSDFLPPIEREDLAALAHALVRVIDIAGECALLTHSRASTRAERWEGDLCLRLCKQLCADVILLKTIRNPKQMPALRDFRALLAKAERTSSRYSPLRAELSQAFDTLVEVMLHNI